MGLGGWRQEIKCPRSSILMDRKFETSLGYTRLLSENRDKPAFLSLPPPSPLRRQFIVPTNVVSPVCMTFSSCPMSPQRWVIFFLPFI